MTIKEVKIAAIRGRYCEDGSIQQKLEINDRGVANTIITVQKDNMVLECRIGLIQPKDREYKKNNKPRVEHIEFSKDNTCPALRASIRAEVVVEEDKMSEKLYEGNYKIRKLTPIETWRLMGFSDEDFHKAEEVNSNTQLYKQAGNSIVVPVLEGIFEQLFLD